MGPMNALDDDLPRSSGFPGHGSKRPLSPRDYFTAAIVPLRANGRHSDKTFRLVCLVPIRKVFDEDDTFPMKAFGDKPRSKLVVPVDGSLP